MTMRRLLAPLAALLLLLPAPASAQAPDSAVLSAVKSKVTSVTSGAKGLVTQLQNLGVVVDSALARASRTPARIDTIYLTRTDTLVVVDTLVRVDTVRVRDVPPPVVVTPPAPPVVVTPPAPPVVVAPPAPPVVVTPAPQPAPVVAVGPGDLVQYPDSSVAFILGPALRAGSTANPWPWFDSNALAKGIEWAGSYPAKIVNDAGTALVYDADAAFNRNYYDVTMALYGEYFRTGNTAVLDGARKRADAFYSLLVFNQTKYGGSGPRQLGFGGLMLRALDGRPELWPFITQTVREQFNGWVYLRKDYPGLYFGLRDGSYMLIYAAWLAKVHPDPAVRAEFRAKALDASRNYYVRLQRADGGWYWEDESVQAPGGVFAQPFMVGLLLEAFTYVHQLTGDPVVAASIPRAVDWLQSYYRGAEPVKGLNGVRWRNLPYFVYTNGTWNSATELPGGWDTNTLREARQANSTVVHAYGYAYQLTKDPKYRQWGDEMFAATYGRGQGPGADQFSNLADYQEKEYGQAYRSAGRYLVWRAAQ